MLTNFIKNMFNKLINSQRVFTILSFVSPAKNSFMHHHSYDGSVDMKEAADREHECGFFNSLHSDLVNNNIKWFN
jgi:hypothetical protein